MRTTKNTSDCSLRSNNKSNI